MAGPNVPYLIGVNCDANIGVILTNVSRGTSLFTVSNASGQALFDLANLPEYAHGDSLDITQDYTYQLQDGEFLLSESIFFNQTTVTRATIILTGNFSNAVIELTADGATLETTSNNTNYSFTTTGQNLKYKITANGGTVALTDVRVEYNQ